jgi:hypothetical protein
MGQWGEARRNFINSTLQS